MCALLALGLPGVGDDGRYSDRIPDLDALLAQEHGNVAILCGDPVVGEPTTLVFESIQPGDVETELPELLAANAREVVNFEWNPSTGELSYRTTTSTKIFSDLERPSTQTSFQALRSCGSRP